MVLAAFLLTGARLSRGEPGAHAYGGIYMAPPEEPLPLVDWELGNRGDTMQDFPERIRGRFIGLIGPSLGDESRMVLIETTSGQRRAIAFHLLSPEDCERAMSLASANSGTNSPATALPAEPWPAKWDTYRFTENQEGVRYFTSDHFVYFFGTGDGKESDLLADENFVQGIKSECEAIWNYYANQLHVPMPFDDAGDGEALKLPVYFFGTSLPGIKDTGPYASNRSIYLYPRQFKGDIPIFAHELVHVIQAFSGGFKWDRRHGKFREAHADWLSLQWNPTKGGKAIKNGTRFSDYPLFSWQVSYGNWPLLQYLSETYGPEICIQPWHQNQRDSDGSTLESPLQVIYRLGAEEGLWSGDGDWAEFADTLAMAAAKKAYWDFIPQSSYLFRLRQTDTWMVKWQTRKQPSRVDDEWQCKTERAPGAFGYHTIELVADASGKAKADQISVRVESSSEAGWRLVLIARDADWNCRYSPVTRDDASAVLPVEKGDRAWALMVMAVPETYQAHTREEEESGSFARHPFKVVIEGAAPGFAGK